MPVAPVGQNSDKRSDKILNKNFDTFGTRMSSPEMNEIRSEKNGQCDQKCLFFIEMFLIDQHVPTINPIFSQTLKKTFA
jgi:hypothetical protein